MSVRGRSEREIHAEGVFVDGLTGGERCSHGVARPKEERVMAHRTEVPLYESGGDS